MAAKKKSKGSKKESRSQSVEVPTLMGAVQAMDNQIDGSSRAPVPRRRKDPRITPKFRKLK